MKSKVYSLIFCIGFLSCQNQKDENLDDIVQVNENGVQENKVDELSVEDVQKLMQASENPSQSYTAVLNNEIEKSYPISADTNQEIICNLDAIYPNVQLYLYKETISSVKRDSSSYVKIKDYKLIASSDSCSYKSKKAAKYKAVVKLSPKFQTMDSTCDFTLKIYKK